ncbi:hypothetical protein ACHAWF_018986 [Thalassiosira exigua]
MKLKFPLRLGGRRERSPRRISADAYGDGEFPDRPSIFNSAPPSSAVPIARARSSSEVSSFVASSHHSVPAAIARPIHPRTQWTCRACRCPIVPGAEPHVRVKVPGAERGGSPEEERRYHKRCFECHHCEKAIDTGREGFCLAKTESGGEERPFHRECFRRHFGWTCVVCEEPLPVVYGLGGSESVHPTDGGGSRRNNNNASGAGAQGHASGGPRLDFLRHPFFERERMCPHHLGSACRASFRRSDPRDSGASALPSEEVLGDVRRCAGCHRFEPARPSKRFVDVGDADTGRCVCLACCRTVVTTSEEGRPLWGKVADFFEGPLGLLTAEESSSRGGGVTRKDMEDIPVLIVGTDALNDERRRPGAESDAHGHGDDDRHRLTTRGLCLSERHRGGDVTVTAVLCLSGLPADLTASILAHEATHAWIKLHPNFSRAEPLPLKVEEGIAQLVAFLFLNDLESAEEMSSPSSQHSSQVSEDEKDDDSNPSDERLRQYFRFCIETDEGDYGEGFRAAARVYAEMGMQELLYHVALHRDFPPLT